MNIKTKNKTEIECYEKLMNQGWTVYKKGWPDFWCVRGDELVLIEVKPNDGHRLKNMQYLLMNELAEHGINCYKYCPENGFELVTRNSPRAYGKLRRKELKKMEGNIE